MTTKTALNEILSELGSDNNGAIRLLAIYSAAIVLDDEALLQMVVNDAQRLGVERSDLYEVVLQSYLFLGFPRMLNAANILNQQLPAEQSQTNLGPISNNESKDWWEKGTVLCRQIYGDKYEPLKQKVAAMAPEIFRWMLIEGYGKVLSRPGLSIQKRELSIIAFLIVDNRPMQLKYHILGAMNVGVSTEMICQIIGDLRSLAPEGTDRANEILAGIKSS